MTLPNLPGPTETLWREFVDTPAVVIDLDVVERNILRAQHEMNRAGVALRPHIKTHKIPSIARAQIAAGARGITVQKLGEGEVMADAGITDILISYNIVGPQKLARLAALAERVRLTVSADSVAVVTGLAEIAAHLAQPLSVLVECDTGMHRCGVARPDDASALAIAISRTPGLSFAGLMTYPLPGQRHLVADWLRAADRACKSVGLPPGVISSGGTPDLFLDTLDTIVNEYRVGTYVYNDRSLLSRGACSADACALTIWSTVISSNFGNRAVLDAGSKILTSDLVGLSNHGVVVGRDDISIVGLSEEHGHLHISPSSNAVSVGEKLRIIPNHACVVSNMVDQVTLVRGDYFVRTEEVAARGKIS